MGGAERVVDPVQVVTAFLRQGGELLLLRRSDRVGTYRGRWAAVSGYLEEPTALTQALREVEEETGVARRDLRLARDAPPLAIEDPTLGRRWLVHPFLFDLEVRPPIRLDWEHSAYRWASPTVLSELPTVPGLSAALQACWPDAFGPGGEDRGE